MSSFSPDSVKPAMYPAAQEMIIHWSLSCKIGKCTVGKEFWRHPLIPSSKTFMKGMR